MINLLPPKEKKDLLEQWRLRLTIVLGIVFLSFFVILFLVLSLINIYIELDLKTKKLMLDEQERAIKLNQDVEEDIREANSLLAELDSFYQSSLDLTQVFEDLDQDMPSGIYLTDFTLAINKVKDEFVPTVSVSGFSPRRETLVDLREKLREDFSNVEFSPKSWEEPLDVKFNVTFELNGQEP